ncbi:hypothetical protein V6N13_104962 [Hibiscus sabdariffa]
MHVASRKTHRNVHGRGGEMRKDNFWAVCGGVVGKYEVLKMDEDAPIGPNSPGGHQVVLSEKHASDSIGKESIQMPVVASNVAHTGDSITSKDIVLPLRTMLKSDNHASIQVVSRSSKTVELPGKNVGMKGGGVGFIGVATVTRLSRVKGVARKSPYPLRKKHLD